MTSPTKCQLSQSHMDNPARAPILPLPFPYMPKLTNVRYLSMALDLVRTRLAYPHSKAAHS